MATQEKELSQACMLPHGYRIVIGIIIFQKSRSAQL